MISLTSLPALVAEMAELEVVEGVIQEQAEVDRTIEPAAELGQVVKIDGSRQMQAINQALKAQFEADYPGSEVTLEANGTESALEALLQDEIELAAIGRSLSADEKALGLREVPVSQDGIAIITGRKNSFQGPLTLAQFAHIFRGEITDWSEVGGAPGPIRFIDRPLTSETRTVLGTYGILGELEQAEGDAVVRLETDDTAEVIRQLKDDGISYAIASQVKDQPRVNLVKMAVLLDTLPGNQYYPYTQTRGYAYRPEREAAVLPFLAWIGGESGGAAVATAKAAEAAAVTSALNPPVIRKLVEAVTPAESPGMRAQGATAIAAVEGTNSQSQEDIPFWLWLLFPLALLLLWLGRRQSEDKPSDASDTAVSSSTSKGPAPQEPAPVAPSAPISPPVSSPPATDTKPVPPSTVPVMPSEPEPSAPITAAPVKEKILSPQAYYDRGWQLIEAGQLDAAVTAFDQALQANANWALAYLGKGTALLKLDRYQAAIASFDRGLPELTGQDTTRLPGGLLFAMTVWLNRGRAQLKLGQAEAALSDVEQALRLDSTSLEALRVKGDALLVLGRQREADECYRLANGLGLPETPATPAVSESPVGGSDVSPAESPSEYPAAPSEPESSAVLANGAVDPNTANGLYQEGLNCLISGQLKEAETYFKRLLDLFPAYVLGMVGLGRVLLKLNQPEDALGQFERALELESTQLDAWVGKGDALMVLGRTDAGERSYAQAAALRTGKPSTAEPEAPLSVDAPVPEAVDAVPCPPAPPMPDVVPEPPGAIASAVSNSRYLTIHSQRDCYALEPAQMDRLQALATTRPLAPGRHTVRIASGTFSYWTDNRLFDPEPWVILWIYGGRFMNLKTQVEVGATWSTLNGYDDMLTLEVQEAATLCALFLDTYIDDNSGQIILSVSDTETLTVDSQENCYRLDDAALNAIQSEANSTQLQPGTYVFQIEKGVFSYWSDQPKFAAEPWVMLWIYGGAVVNDRTQVKVGATWASLNGYEDTVTLTVLETTTVCGLFFDTYKDDNSGEITLSITQKMA